MTQLNPNFDTFGIDGLPQFACPDLSNRGTSSDANKSWVFPITKSSPCGAVMKYSRRLRNNRYQNGASLDASCIDYTKRLYLDENNDEDDDEDDSDPGYELKSTGSNQMIVFVFFF